MKESNIMAAELIYLGVFSEKHLHLGVGGVAVFREAIVTCMSSFDHLDIFQ